MIIMMDCDVMIMCYDDDDLILAIIFIPVVICILIISLLTVSIYMRLLMQLVCLT